MKSWFDRCGLAIAIAIASTAPVFAQDYFCKLNGKGQRGWVPPEILVLGLAKDKNPLVLDGVIAHHNDKKPMEGKVIKRAGSKTTFYWILNQRSAQGARFDTRYKATIDEKTLKVMYEVKLLQSHQSQFARGQCEVFKRR